MIAEKNDFNVNNNRLINISVNQNVLNLCESIPEVKVSESETEVLNIKNSVREGSKGFNPEVSGSLRPSGYKDPELREWEKNILVHLNNVNFPENDENEILNRDAKLKEEVIKLFLENFSTLALHPNHYGKTNLLELRIELQPGAVPKRSKVRPLNPDQRANLKEQLDEWIQGIIEPANSPWASPLVPVKKKDGRRRWVTNLRLLNDVTIKDAYPLMNI